MKRIDKFIDILTGEEKVIERDETPEEKTFRQELEAKVAANEQAATEAAAAKAALLAKLGITEEEAKLLFS